MNFFWLYLGFAHFALRRARKVVNSASNPINTYSHWLIKNAEALLIRGLGIGVLYSLLRFGLPSLGGYIGVTVELPEKFFSAPVMYLLGFFFDAWLEGFLERFPRYKSEVPAFRGGAIFSQASPIRTEDLQR